MDDDAVLRRAGEIEKAERERVLERTPASARLFERASRTMPLGVASSFQAGDPYPIYLSRGRGSAVWDLDGNEYVDYCLSFGPLILGHGHPRVMKAIRDSLLSAGTTMFGTPHELEAATQNICCESSARTAKYGSRSPAPKRRFMRSESQGRFGTAQ